MPALAYLNTEKFMIITAKLLLENKTKRKLFTIEPEKPFQDAVEIMAENKISALLVLENDELIGIVSERDYIRKAAPKRIVPWEITVEELMTKEVIVVPPSENIQACMQIMTSNRFRHLPVVEDDVLLGIISITDVVSALRAGNLAS
ncbi:MAG: CBS domain-containing protein [Gammaproteobacteria bacterium]